MQVSRFLLRLAARIMIAPSTAYNDHLAKFGSADVSYLDGTSIYVRQHTKAHITSTAIVKAETFKNICGILYVKQIRKAQAPIAVSIQRRPLTAAVRKIKKTGVKYTR